MDVSVPAGRTWPKALLWIVFAVLLVGCDRYPRDPNGTLDEVTDGTMRVGLVARAPWVVQSDTPPAGVEVELARQLAAELGAEISWLVSSETDVLDALKRHQLDLVVGGFTSVNPWKARVAFTRPYYHERLVIAAPEPTPLEELDGISVVAAPGSAAAAYVAEHDGTPVAEDAATPLHAKSMWQLDADEHAVFTLHTDEHVFAVPQGENAWLIAVDRFLRGREGAVRTALQAAP